MANNPKTKRTQIKDLLGSEKELTAAEACKIKGGGKPTKDQILETPPPPIAGATATTRKTGEPLPDIDVSIGKKY